MGLCLCILKLKKTHYNFIFNFWSKIHNKQNLKIRQQRFIFLLKSCLYNVHLTSEWEHSIQRLKNLKTLRFQIKLKLMKSPFPDMVQINRWSFHLQLVLSLGRWDDVVGTIQFFHVREKSIRFSNVFDDVNKYAYVTDSKVRIFG